MKNLKFCAKHMETTYKPPRVWGPGGSLKKPATGPGQDSGEEALHKADWLVGCLTFSWANYYWAIITHLNGGPEGV